MLAEDVFDSSILVKAMRKILNIVLIASLIGSASYAMGEVIAPDEDETISTFCECMRVFSGCDREFFASAAGKPMHSWYQTNYLKKGVKVDLNAACYRTRDKDGMGNGECCTIANNEAKSISNLFRGTRK